MHTRYKNKGNIKGWRKRRRNKNYTWRRWIKWQTSNQIVMLYVTLSPSRLLPLSRSECVCRVRLPSNGSVTAWLREPDRTLCVCPSLSGRPALRPVSWDVLRIQPGRGQVKSITWHGWTPRLLVVHPVRLLSNNCTPWTYSTYTHLRAHTPAGAVSVSLQISWIDVWLTWVKRCFDLYRSRLYLQAISHTQWHTQLKTSTDTFNCTYYILCRAGTRAHTHLLTFRSTGCHSR